MDSNNQYILVVAAVKDHDLTFSGGVFVDPPQVVVS